MQVVINSYGAYLHRHKNCLEVELDEEKKIFSGEKVDSILITKGVRLSSDVVVLAVENDIEIQFLDKYGEPAGKLWHPDISSSAAVRRRQLEIIKTKKGTLLIKSLIKRKAENFIKHLQELSRRRSEKKKSFIEDKVKKIRELMKCLVEIDGVIENVRSQIMGYEGNMGKHYFSALSNLLPRRYKFAKRSFKPAEDEFNCYLNYGYGILYTRMEKSCLLAGFDPHIGILHSDGHNQNSFIFDVIEPFRHFINVVVMKLFSRKKVSSKHFKKIKGGLLLDKSGKELLVNNLNEYFAKRIQYDGRNISISEVINYDLKRLADHLVYGKEYGLF